MPTHTYETRRVKAYVVRAEDARLLGDMPLVGKLYAELHTLNRRLVGEYAKRANNHRVSQRKFLNGVDNHTFLFCHYNEGGEIQRQPNALPDFRWVPLRRPRGTYINRCGS